MGRRDELGHGSERVRIGSWRGSQRVGLVTPVGGLISPGPALVDRACRELAMRGYREVLTGALAPDEVAAFESCAFELRDELHLLAIDLHRPMDDPRLPDRVELRTGHRRTRRPALEVDTRAFPLFWRLDDEGLVEALTATSEVRFRVARSVGRWSRLGLGGGPVLGYAVTGLTGRMGYLQRLAVDPTTEGRGIGRALVMDSLYWLRDMGADRAVVNTQVDNSRALGLYRSIGFEQLPSGLAVLGRSLEDQLLGDRLPVDASPSTEPDADVDADVDAGVDEVHPPEGRE